jgi:peptide deformylase
MTVEYYDESLNPVRETFDKFACRMIQHELSHLDGDLFTDHMAPIRKKMMAKKLTGIAAGRVAARYKTRLK